MNDSIVSQLGISTEVFDQMVELRRDLHRHPELSHKEQKTAELIARQLERLGIQYKMGVAETGIVAEIPGQIEGPLVALRADMDALPIHEETGLEFSSVHEDVMHACGHDGHSSMLVGAAGILLKNGPPPVTVRLIWQPAEETGTGANAMVAAGVLKDVELIFGGHLDRRYPAGELIVTEGAVNASTDLFFIDIEGQQGHGARPHEAIDAVVVGSLLVIAIQTIVSREVDPSHPSVISIGKFESGSAPNIIAGTARLEGTIRTQDEDVRRCLKQAISRICKAIGQLHGAKINLQMSSGSPPVFNTPDMTHLARKAAESIVGEERVKSLHTVNMGGEDFSYYLEQVEGCYIRFGGQLPGLGGYPAHSSRFDFDERALAAGAAWFAEVARMAGEHLNAKYNK
jgi:hippurate hydrolase